MTDRQIVEMANSSKAGELVRAIVLDLQLKEDVIGAIGALKRGDPQRSAVIRCLIEAERMLYWKGSVRNLSA